MCQYIDSVSLGEGSNACRFLVSFLKDDALTWWRSFSRDDLRIFDQITIDEIFEGLRAQFSDIDRNMKLRSKIFNLRQQGSVAQYITTFRQLQLELGTERLDDIVARDMFLRGLKPAVQQWVMMQ